jgi:imidazolonepropionase-like amidohydrolase
MSLAIEIWRRASISFTLTILISSICLPVGEAGILDESERLAFVHAFVIPMDRERVLPDQTVIVAGGRIQEIGPYKSTKIPDGVTRIDATGQYLIPAFCDMHVHLLGDAWNIMFPPEARIPADDIDMESFLFPFVANGVTTVQILSATEDQIDLRKQIALGEILGPRLILSRMIDGVVIQGRWLSGGQIRERLEVLAASQKALTTNHQQFRQLIQ